MTKKILIGLFILLIGVILIFAYNFYNNVKKPISTNTYAAIPQNAAIIIQETDFNQFYSKLSSSSIIWEELVENSLIGNSINKQLNYFKSIINSPKINLLIKNQPITASVHLSGANNYNFLFYIPTVTEIEESNFIQELKTLTNSNPEERVYEDVKIYNFKDDSNQKLSLIYHKSIIVFSYSSILIEDVIRQLSSDNSLLDNHFFQKTINTSGEANAGNIFVNHNIFQRIPHLFIDNSYKNYLKPLEDYAVWSALDATLKNNSLTLNGFSLATDTNNNYLSLFKSQKPQDMEMLNYIPNHVAFLYHLGFSNSKQFFNDRKSLLKAKNQFFNYQKYIDEQNEAFGIDLEEEFITHIGNEIAMITIEPLTENISNDKFIVIHSKDIEQMKSSLLNIAQKSNGNDNSLHNESTIHQLNFPNLFPNLLGKPFFNLNHLFFTFINDYVVFGESESALTSYLTKIEYEKTLANDENFKIYKDNLSSSSNIFIYNNIARSVNLYPHYLNQEYSSSVTNNTEFLRKFEAMALQVSSSKNDLYYNNIYLKYNPVYKQDTRTVWETKLDSIIKVQPQIVVNHTNNTKEIIVQDINNKLYLISNTGKVLWSKQLQEQIIGKIHQVDVYKNNKLQLLFNTASKIYLLDRNGKNVENFPVKLESIATNGITPLDYSNNKNYRLLIGCNNNKVYNYDITGRLVSGWEYNASNSYANSNIWHFAIQNKDYIVIPLESGEVKIVERSGKDRILLKNKLTAHSKNTNLIVNIELKNCFLVSTDTIGNVVKLYLNDRVENINFSNNNNSFFELTNLSNKNSYDYVFTTDNSLKVYDTDKNNTLEFETESAITNKPLFFKMPDKSIKIGLVTTDKIYLLNNNGVLQDNFPLAGSTLFSISDLNNDNTSNLVVADKNILYMYNLE